MKHLIRLLVIVVLFVAVVAITIEPRAQPELKAHKGIMAARAVLDTQVAAWNRGDIEGYMDGYDRSPHTVFVSGDRVSYGWQTVLDRYKKTYNSREKMGTLTFSDLEFRILSKDAVLVLG